MNVVLLTARDPLRAGDGALPARTATNLAEAGDDVTLVLLEDAVALARAGHELGIDLQHAVDAGVVVLAEREALARRAVKQLADGVKPTELGATIDLLMAGSDRQAWL